MVEDLEPTFLAALHDAPGDATTWLALADYLEESGQDQRAELIRLQRQLRALPVLRRVRQRATLEDRLADLLRSGVRPVSAELVNFLGMRFTLVEPGTFRMGAVASECGRNDEEGPVHEVEITRPFYLGTFQVTQDQFERVMGVNPSHFSLHGIGKSSVERLDTSQFPVERVSWLEAFQFCTRLTELAGSPRWVYRLPTEAEWEYACRGGAASTAPYYLGSAISSRFANFDGTHPHPASERGTYLVRTCRVGSYPPNALGLYDMAGNVWEWCADWFDENYYRVSPTVDPPGPPMGNRRVLRGGAFWNWGSCLRAARRVRNTPDSREQAYGFRVVMEWRHGAVTSVG
ncbi:MAG: SUMF1/EgtB/PvdO family nonheme iron enzyme [Gemmataceae bacterium]